MKNQTVWCLIVSSNAFGAHLSVCLNVRMIKSACTNSSFCNSENSLLLHVIDSLGRICIRLAKIWIYLLIRCEGNIWFVDSVCMQHMLLLLTLRHTRRSVRDRKFSVLRFHKCCIYPSSQLFCYTLTKCTTIISCSN